MAPGKEEKGRGEWGTSSIMWGKGTSIIKKASSLKKKGKRHENEGDAG